MGLFHLTAVLLIAFAVAEERVTVSISKQKVDVGEDVTITWKVRGVTDTTALKLVKVVLETVEGDEENRVEQNILATENPVIFTKPYSEANRFTFTKTEVGNDYDAMLEIRNAQPEDSGLYGLYIVLSQVTSTQLLDVYTSPEHVHFVNYTGVDDLEFEGDERKTVSCMAMGGVPLPRLDVFVDKVNYTRFFNHRESQVKLPECYSDNMEDSCILHPVTDSSTTAFDWAPDVSAHGKMLTCSAYHEGSDMQPITASVRVRMEYKPKFRCFQKQKVALHEENFDIKCTIRASPDLYDNVKFEIESEDGEKETLEPGDKTEDMEIEFMQLKTGQLGETNVTLRIDQVFERHYDMKFHLSAENELGKNSTIITLVEEDYVRGASSFVSSGIVALIANCLFFIAL